jgi:hypothetical protein
MDVGFRFQKSLRILPGVKLRLSKKGVSLSLGKRGAGVNVGKPGLTGNVGLPGTGLSYRQRLFGKKSGPSGCLIFMLPVFSALLFLMYFFLLG